MENLLPYTDIIFANEDEAAHLGKKLNWGDNLQEIAKKLADYPKENDKRKRIVVFTQGAQNTLVCQDGKVTEYPPIKIEKEKIIDTNGAGDSFTGGFLSQLVQEKSIEECIAAAHYCAWECIQRSGASYPKKSNFIFKKNK